MIKQSIMTNYDRKPTKPQKVISVTCGYSKWIAAQVPIDNDYNDNNHQNIEIKKYTDGKTNKLISGY